jgi:hypothetical protein
MFNEMVSHLARWNVTSGSRIVLGETNSNQRCSKHAPSGAKQLADGYRASNAKLQGFPAYFQAWNEATDTSCYVTKYFINPPYTPSVP